MNKTLMSIDSSKMLASLYEPAVLIDETGYIKDANHQFCELSDFYLDDLFAKKWSIFITKENYFTVNKTIKELLESGRLHESIQINAGLCKRTGQIIEVNVDISITDFGYLFVFPNRYKNYNLRHQQYLMNNDLDKMSSNVETTINSLLAVIESINHYTSEHQTQVCKTAMDIGKKIKIPDFELKTLKYASLVHDISRLTFPSSILHNKILFPNLSIKTPLNQSIHGYELIDNLNSPWPIAETVFKHHKMKQQFTSERIISAEQIYISTKILNFADYIVTQEIDSRDKLMERLPFARTKFDDELLNAYH